MFMITLLYFITTQISCHCSKSTRIKEAHTPLAILHKKTLGRCVLSDSWRAHPPSLMYTSFYNCEGGIIQAKKGCSSFSKTPHLLHLTAMSNMSLHCICLVLPLTRTLELLHVRCIACITSRVAKPMAEKKHTQLLLLMLQLKSSVEPQSVSVVPLCILLLGKKPGVSYCISAPKWSAVQISFWTSLL